MARRLLFLVFGLVVGFGGFAQADTIRNFTVAGWYGGAHTKPGTNIFSHCAAIARANNGIFMMFSVNRAYNWSVAFHSPTWTLIKGSQYDIAFVIDDGQALPGKAFAISLNTVEVPLAESANLLSQFRRGRLLRVAAAGNVLSFNLDGTSAVLPSLFSCVQQYLNPTQPNGFTSAARFNDRSASPATAASSAQRNSAHQAEATVMLANVLARSGVNGFSLAPPEQVEKLDVDAAWIADDLIGTVVVLPNVRADDPNVQSFLIGHGAKACKGAFLSGSLPEAEKKSVRIFTTCQEALKTSTTYYTAVPRPKGGIYLFTTAAFGAQDAVKSQDDVKRADDGVRAAAFQVVK